ncbi:2-amino-4-hydroxy-6-hydroxymethyldihydropteridine diphosphokinase [Allosphingosinicella vermicomposti]|uniref:2-amino-4-hydroxy-6- hydroxymethyldihydropteridine diphosphokinase n=1 Tax=Allosphingosinicella vermicomposti TaxID=614671 RepID=UPI000D108135|nr:2-amino-4-hydroxy-6-hydroxymethyldihydropteridine diphosphokinase [Allosphingosinicella vermicomposti]
MGSHLYAIALGSNRRHGQHGAPTAILRAAASALDAFGQVEVISSIRATPALGPAGRGFANAALILATDMEPPALLAGLKAIERAFGRRAGRRWGPRVLDLDILLWSEGAWESPGLVIPHAELRHRHFVLAPLAEIAPDWRDPISGLTIRQLQKRLTAPRPVDPDAARS